MIGVGARVTGGFDSAGIRRMVDMKAKQSVETGARTGAIVARAVASQRVRSGAMAALRVEPAKKTTTGYVAAFVCYPRHGWFQNDGTLGNRRPRARLRQPGVRSRAPGTGIKPLYFLFFGLGAGRNAMARTLGVRVTRVRG